MSRVASLIKSVPALHRAARRTKKFIKRVGGEEPLDGFYTLSPDVLVAMVRCLRIQQDARAAGNNLIDGHGYYEFGMFRGFSFWFTEQLSRTEGCEGLQLFGFDSFEGLPEPELEVESIVFQKGEFCGKYEAVMEHLRRWNTDMTRVQLFKGYYSTELFQRFAAQQKFPPISICLIDADLYNSCVPVLEFIKDRLVVGSILLFDDYNQIGEDDNSGERLALREFEQRYPNFQKEYLFNYGWEGIAFRVTQLP